MKKNPNSLIFNVGPWKYTAKIAPGEISCDGSPTGVAWIEFDREILIAADMPRRHRLSMLTWGITRAWVSHAGQPSKCADFCATVIEQIFRDLNKQGGIQALKRLRPSKPIKTIEPKLGPLTEIDETDPFRRRIA
jgi:hypothetical protein